MTHKERLENFKKEHDFFVGIDSDGCAFPTMELKHKECFIPNIIKYFRLQTISSLARETAEFINLYSIHRGINRFPGLLKTIEMLKKREGTSSCTFPDTTALEKYVDSGLPMSNAGLIEYMKNNQNPDLQKLLEWSNAVNTSISEMVHGVSPFPLVRESLKKFHGKADLMVVSATPVPALEKEWKEHQMDSMVQLIAGQEMGKKQVHLSTGAEGKYDKDKILMVGDAPGDHRAAGATGALFYPIIPGREHRSWENFYQEGIDHFLNGSFQGRYQETLIKEFYSFLPETPSWES